MSGRIIVETLTLPDPRPTWKGAPSARIRLARRGADWMVSAEAALADRGFGDSTAWELGRHAIFASREVALACGLLRVHAFLAEAGDRKGVKRISGWHDQLAAAPQPLKRYVLRRDR